MEVWINAVLTAALIVALLTARDRAARKRTKRLLRDAMPDGRKKRKK